MVNKLQKQMINKKIRICIECGSLAIRSENKMVRCTECGKKFFIGEKSGTCL